MVKNITKKTTLSSNAIICKSAFSKARGLMLSFAPKTLIFEFRRECLVPLHMCFVLFPIDVIFLDKNKKVVEIKENFRPWTFYTPKAKAIFVIELKQGTVKKSRTGIGDQISF